MITPGIAPGLVFCENTIRQGQIAWTLYWTWKPVWKYLRFLHTKILQASFTMFYSTDFLNNFVKNLQENWRMKNW